MDNNGNGTSGPHTVPLHKKRPHQHSYPEIGEGPVVVTVTSASGTTHSVPLEIWDGRKIGYDKEIGSYTVQYWDEIDELGNPRPKVRFDHWIWGARVGGGLWKT
ncbi:hypothetical protein C4564_05770 [Candidatus Microgenomates bacterium]|nr:MAG: hypothetical protein C4564_05770 [Candidatus Microgenomates bacterium]